MIFFFHVLTCKYAKSGQEESKEMNPTLGFPFALLRI